MPPLDEPIKGIQPNIIEPIEDTIKVIRDDGPGHDYVEEIADAIKRRRKEGRIGILPVGQYLDFCLDVGDSFFMMVPGSIVAKRPIADLNDDILKQHLTL